MSRAATDHIIIQNSVLFLGLVKHRSCNYIIQHGKLVEAEVTSLPASLIVVSGLRKDFLHLPRRGHVTVFCELDMNLTFHSAPLARREYFTLQVRVGYRRVWST